MNLDELKLQVSQDLKVDDEHLDTESLKNQEIKAKYLEHKSKFELLLFKAKGDYKRLYREKWEYYGGKVNLMQKFMQVNHLTSKFSKQI